MAIRGISRRGFLARAGLAAVGYGLSRVAHGGEKDQPNIVFIIADDLGWADAGYQGAAIRTPHIDGLAKAGVRFDHHYVAPTCTPTRVGFLTGQYPSRFGVVSPAYGKIFDDDTATLPGILAGCGYRTVISGKWHMGSPPECLPLRHGFTDSYGYFHGQIDPYTHLYKNGEACWHRNDTLVEEEGHATDLITDEAVRVIEDAADRPLFLYVAYSVPHFPLNEPEQWTKPYEGVFDSASRRLYAASVTHMDAGIGRILDALDRTSKKADTLVVFVSDNGGQQQWHSETQYHGRYADKPHDVLGDNRPLRGWKGECYEGGIRVPAVAAWPGVLDPGTMEAPMHIVDWLPTLCAAAGCAPRADAPLDGTSRWAAIQAHARTAPPRPLYWKTPNAAAIRQGDWKLIVDHKGDRAELYNIAEDPFEKTDQAKAYPDRVKSLRALLEQIAARDRSR